MRCHRNPTASFTYDPNGNLTSDGAVTYAYDIENRIIGASGAKTANLRYDPLGRLYEVNAGSASSATRFLYDGDALVAEYDGTSNALSRRYIHGSGVDEPLVWYEGAGLTNRRSLRANHQGSIIAVADGAGQQIGALTYDPYGIPGSANFGRFQYTGQIWLAELGVYHYKARAYSPTLGRFLQTDPIGYEDQVNLYAYVGNDPVNKFDPSGKQEALAACAGGPIACAAGALVTLVKFAIAGILLNEVNSDTPTTPVTQEPRPLTDGERKGLSDAGKTPDGGGRTAAGRAGEKHGSRAGSAFPPTKGTPDDINKQGQGILEGMVKDPKSTVEVDDRGRTTVISPDGRGARYNPDGSLQGFREPEPKLRK